MSWHERSPVASRREAIRERSTRYRAKPKPARVIVLFSLRRRRGPGEGKREKGPRSQFGIKGQPTQTPSLNESKKKPLTRHDRWTASGKMTGDASQPTQQTRHTTDRSAANQRTGLGLSTPLTSDRLARSDWKCAFHRPPDRCCLVSIKKMKLKKENGHETQ